jgi:hypothetical protein
MNKLAKDKATWEELRKNSHVSFRLDNLDQSKTRDVGEIATELTHINSDELLEKGYLETEKDGELSKQAKLVQENCITKQNEEECKKYFNKGIGDSLGQYRLKKSSC